MSDELIPHVDENGSAFFECELRAGAFSLASELEQSGLSDCHPVWKKYPYLHD